MAHVSRVQRERIAGSFLSFVPELLQDRVELQNCMSVEKLHLFHKEINDNDDNNLLKRINK